MSNFFAMAVEKHPSYDIEESLERINNILDAKDENYIERDRLFPKESEFTETNGFYYYITAVFVDIIDSSSLMTNHYRNTVSRIYKSFISEVTAILASYKNCYQINIHGDCVWGVFDTPLKDDIKDICYLVSNINGLIELLNWRLEKKGLPTIEVGIGIDFGRALITKAGKEEIKVSDLIYMGDVVNEACHLANKAGRGPYENILVGPLIYQNIDDDASKNEQFKDWLSRVSIDGKEYYNGYWYNPAFTDRIEKG